MKTLDLTLHFKTVHSLECLEANFAPIVMQMIQQTANDSSKLTIYMAKNWINWILIDFKNDFKPRLLLLRMH